MCRPDLLSCRVPLQYHAEWPAEQVDREGHEECYLRCVVDAALPVEAEALRLASGRSSGGIDRSVVVVGRGFAAEAAELALAAGADVVAVAP